MIAVSHYIVRIVRDIQQKGTYYEARPYYWIILAAYRSGRKQPVMQSMRVYRSHNTARRAALRFLTDMRAGTVTWRGEC